MKLDKNGNNLPGWVRLRYKDEYGNRKKYYGQYNTIETILINAWYLNYKKMNYASELRCVEIGNGLIIDLKDYVQIRIEDP